jgi:crotonobetainyl-CoA:carnitine CoA-transferase CaiB-like acyl-CoA transferase
MEPRSDLPLSSVRVVALEQAAAAPFCSRQLADMGADVIKIERPGSGDFAREYDGALNGLSAYFAWLNRGKRSIVLDLKQADDQAVFAKLLEGCDVFVHNLAPGAVERLGFSYEAFSARNSRLIWCAISGYGPDGPCRDKKAYDLLVQAESGVISLTGSAEAPAKVGISMADIAAGLYGYSSILAALLNRAKTGKGDRIEISMLECLIEWMMPPIYVWLGTGRIPERMGIRHNMVAPYGAYACADGLVNFAVQNDREWRRFCEQLLGMPALADDPRFLNNESRVRNRAALESLIDEELKSRKRVEILGQLEAAGLATGAVNDIAAVAQHPQLVARRRWVKVDSPVGVIPALLPPHNLEHADPRMGAVPELGQHTQEILTELGFRGES